MSRKGLADAEKVFVNKIILGHWIRLNCQAPLHHRIGLKCLGGMIGRDKSMLSSKKLAYSPFSAL